MLDELLEQLDESLLQAGEQLKQERYEDALQLCEEILNKYRCAIRYHEYGYLAFYITARAMFEVQVRHVGGVSQDVAETRQGAVLGCAAPDLTRARAAAFTRR